MSFAGSTPLFFNIDINHEQGSGDDFFAYDGTESGPLFGFGLRF